MTATGATATATATATGACEHCGQPVWYDGRAGVLFRHGPGRSARVACCNGRHVAELSRATTCASGDGHAGPCVEPATGLWRGAEGRLVLLCDRHSRHWAECGWTKVRRL